jgi:hypothetical protein
VGWFSLSHPSSLDVIGNEAHNMQKNRPLKKSFLTVMRFSASVTFLSVHSTAVVPGISTAGIFAGGHLVLGFSPGTQSQEDGQDDGRLFWQDGHGDAG